MQEGKPGQMTDVQEKNTQNNEEKSLDEVFAQLDALAQKLENSETSLEDSFRYYKKGMELLKYCSEKIDTVEKKMMKLNENGELSEF